MKQLDLPIPDSNENKFTKPDAAPEAPMEERLKYGTAFHASVLDRLREMLQLSELAISQRYSDWDDVDEQCRLYVNLSAPAKKGDRTTQIYAPDGSLVKEIPFERSIVFPTSYVVLAVRMSQYMQIMGSQQPIWKLEGRGPEDIHPARLMEAVLDYDMRQCAALLSLYQFFQDIEKYGLGIIYDVWETEYGYIRQQPNPAMTQFFPNYRPSPTWGVTKEFNNWKPVDPFRFYPDPRVSRSNAQKGEFMGHQFTMSYFTILERSQDSGGPYFNIEFLPKIGTVQEARYLPKRDMIPTYAIYNKELGKRDGKGYFELNHLQVKLIPRDWKLGDSDRPETWWFTIANREVIVRAHESPYEHGQFTYGLGESNFDYHALFNPGNIENLDGIQRFMNWLLNSHLENIVKNLNDFLIYAPSLIEEDEILNPGPARHVRLTREGEAMLSQGMQIDQMIHQFPVTDVTQPHLQATQFLWEMVQRMFAVNETSAGSPTSEKKTLGEVQHFMNQAGMRIASSFRIIEEMALMPMVMRAISNRQQFTDSSQFFRIVGQSMAELGGDQRQLIRPGDIQGQFDYFPRSEVMPPDPARQAMVWVQLMLGAKNFPDLFLPGPDGKVLDVRAVFNEIARNLGIKHISQFYRQMTPMDMMKMQGGGPGGPSGINAEVKPDQEVQEGAKRGNLVPIEQARMPGIRGMTP